jgi:hypothetical protein
MSIRFASKDDCAAIAEIYNHAVLHTAAIWNDQTVDAENRISWYEARQLMGYPVLVSEENGVVTGTPLATGATLTVSVIPSNIRCTSIRNIREKDSGEAAQQTD